MHPEVDPHGPFQPLLSGEQTHKWETVSPAKSIEGSTRQANGIVLQAASFKYLLHDNQTKSLLFTQTL